MSYFGNALSELLKRKGMKPIRLSQLSGIDQSMISRYISGDKQWVDPTNLDMLATAISDEPEEQAELIKSHLLDHCHGPGSQLIEINITGEVPRGRQIVYEVKLPPELEEDFALLREKAIKDADVLDMIKSMASILRESDARLAAATQGKISYSKVDPDLEEEIVTHLEEGSGSSSKKQKGARRK